MAGITVCLISDAAIPRVKSAGQPVTMLNLDVNDLGDAVDANVGDGICQTAGGVCTLRAAIEEAVSTAGSHSISISVNGVINLGGPLPNIDNSNGLTLLQISGNGAKNLTVRRNLGGNYQILFISPTFPGAMAVSINGITISNGNSNVSGGGVYSLYSDLTLTGVAFTGNTSQNGSALYAGGAEVVITNCTFNGNSGSGATVAFDTLTPTTFRLESSTITGNTGSGVRLGLGSGANGAIISSTISNNTGNGVGLSGNGGRTVSLLSNIIAGNGGASLVLSGTNSYVSQGYNLASDGGGGYLTGTGDLLSTDPLLGVLGDYGGATSTQALLRGSPAIGAGTSTGTPATDQRGVARVGLSDIGAFESRGFQLVIAGGDNQVALTGATFANPLSVTITAGDSGVPVTGGPVTFSAPGTGASATIAGSPAVVTAGMATSGVLVANGIGGAYSVTATTSGVATPVNFGLRNNAAPKVVSIVRAGASPTSAGSIGYTVTFNESVTGVTAGSFGLALTGAAGAAITGVGGSGTTWTVTVDTAGGTGRIGLNLVTGSGVIDSDGTPIANAPFTGEVYVLSPRVVSIARAGATPTSAGSLGYTVTFSESVTGVSAANFGLVASVAGGAAITGVSGSGTVWTVTVNSGTVKGTIGLDMTGSGGVVDSDGAAVGNLPFAGEVYAIAPKVVSIVRTGASPTSAASIGYTVTFNESVTGVSGANFTLAQTGTGVAAITGVGGSGTTWTVTVDPGTVSGTIGLNMTGSGGVVDSDGAAVGNLPFAGEVYTIAPRVVSIVRTGANPTIAASLGYTVTFSESVTGISAANFALALTGAGGAAITGVGGSGTTWTVTVDTGGGTGQIGLNLVTGLGVFDSDGLPIGNAPFTGEVYTIAPRVVSIVRTGASPTIAASIGYTVTFSESVTGVSAANFGLALTGAGGAAITGVAGSGTTWTVTVNPGTVTGTIGLNMTGSGGVVDSDGAAVGNLPFAGEVYTIAPRVVSIVRTGASPTIAASIGYTVTLSESVTGLSAANFVLAVTGTGGAAITAVGGSGSVWTVTVNPGTSNGTIGLNMTGSGGVVDSDGAAVGNLPFAGEVYTIAPRVVSIVRTGASPTSAASIGYTVTFSESVMGLTAGSFGLALTGAGGAAITGVSGSGTTWTVTVNPGTVSGTIGLNMTGSGGVVDSNGAAVGNLPFAGEVYTIAPRVVSIVRTGASPTSAGSLGYTVTFSESLIGGSAANFALVVTGTVSGTIQSVTGGGTTRTVTVIPGNGVGAIGLNMVNSTGIASGGGIAIAGLPQSGQLYDIDRVPPETAISSGPAATSTSSTATFVFSGNDGGAGSGVASYECRLDSGVYSACVSPKVYTGLGIGRHRFLVRAIDGVGNSDPDPATLAWVINNQPMISGATITASFGGAPQSFPIAIVGDQDQSAATLIVTAINTTGNGILIGSVTIDATGKVTAIIQVGCGATDSTFQLTVTDALGGMATAQLTVRVARSAVAFPGEHTINWRHSAIGAAAGCQPAGPGLSLAAEAAIGAQKPGSLLIFNIHTSRVGSIREETRTAITNTSPTRPIDIHLFFVDGASGMVADSFLHLTPGQTSSLLASEIDPETTGYLIALAVDEHGCPVAFNHLIGETFVRFESGHAANLGALAVSVIDRAAIVCNPGAVTADIRFDGIVWNELPRVIAVDSLPSRAEGNSTMLILNRLGGSLVDGVQRLGAINGLLYDDVERSVSFTLTDSRCQLRGTLGQNFPRTSPRYDSLIPAGRSGWMKLTGEADDTAITGTAIGLGQNRFSQGHNLHLLTTTALVVLTVPVLLP